MGIDYWFKVIVSYDYIVLGIYCDAEIETLCERKFNLKGKNYYLLYLKYHLDRYKFGGIYEGIKKVKMILNEIYAEKYDDDEINKFENQVSETIKSYFNTHCDCDCGCDDCV